MFSNTSSGRQENTGAADKLEGLNGLLQNGLISKAEYEKTHQ